MRGLWIVAGLAALGLAGGAAAQDAGERTATVRPEPVEVRVGATVYELPPTESVAAVVIGRQDTMTGSTLDVVLFVRDEDGWMGYPPVEIVASGALVESTVGLTFTLDSEPLS